MRRVTPQPQTGVARHDRRCAANVGDDKAIVTGHGTSSYAERRCERGFAGTRASHESNCPELIEVHGACVKNKVTGLTEHERQYLIDQQVAQGRAREAHCGAACDPVAGSRHLEVGEIRETQQISASLPRE